MGNVVLNITTSTYRYKPVEVMIMTRSRKSGVRGKGREWGGMGRGQEGRIGRVRNS